MPRDKRAFPPFFPGASNTVPRGENARPDNPLPHGPACWQRQNPSFTKQLQASMNPANFFCIRFQNQKKIPGFGLSAPLLQGACGQPLRAWNFRRTPDTMPQVWQEPFSCRISLLHHFFHSGGNISGTQGSLPRADIAGSQREGAFPLRDNEALSRFCRIWNKRTSNTSRLS